MNSFQVQVLDFTYGFPPAYALTKNLVNVNYRKHYNNFVTGVMFLVALVVVLRQKWIENDCNERVQLFALTSYEWMKEVGIPNVQNAIQEPESDDAFSLAHEIWAVSQLAPGEGILDAVDRITPILLQWKSNDSI